MPSKQEDQKPRNPLNYLPKTGIDQVFMKHDFRFIRPKVLENSHLHPPNLETIHTYESQGERLMFIDQYKNKETRKENMNFTPRVVYDSSDISPYYSGGVEEYIKREELITYEPSNKQAAPTNNTKQQPDYQDPFGQEKIKLVQ